MPSHNQDLPQAYLAPKPCAFHCSHCSVLTRVFSRVGGYPGEEVAGTGPDLWVGEDLWKPLAGSVHLAA